MKDKVLPRLISAFVLIFGLSQAASAAPCTDEVTALKGALNDGICKYPIDLGRNGTKTCEGLNNKLDGANQKLEQGKYSDAARKLADFGATAEDLATRRKPKISMEDYQALIDPYFNEAAICVGSL